MNDPGVAVTSPPPASTSTQPCSNSPTPLHLLAISLTASALSRCFVALASHRLDRSSGTFRVMWGLLLRQAPSGKAISNCSSSLKTAGVLNFMISPKILARLSISRHDLLQKRKNFCCCSPNGNRIPRQLSPLDQTPISMPQPADPGAATSRPLITHKEKAETASRVRSENRNGSRQQPLSSRYLSEMVRASGRRICSTT